jgi:hypothetical protein
MTDALPGIVFLPRPLPLLQLLLQDDDIPGVVRYRTYEVLKAEAANPRLRWAYLPYSMHMAGPREAIQHMIIRKNYGEGPRTCLQQGWGVQWPEHCSRAGTARAFS